MALTREIFLTLSSLMTESALVKKKLYSRHIVHLVKTKYDSYSS